MQVTFTDEQLQFRDTLQRFMQHRSPSREVRRLMDTDQGFDAELWQALAEELALPGLIVPEAYGGYGFGTVELGIAMEEMGRALLCAPFLSSAVLASQALLQAGSEAQKERWLPQLADGTLRGCVAFTEPDGGWTCDGIATTAAPAGSGYRLNGVKRFVIDGATAQLVIVAARAPGSSGLDGLSLFAVAPDASGLERRPLQTLDATRKQAQLHFTDTPAELLGQAGDGAAQLGRVLDLALIALANEMVGGAQRLHDMTIDYVKLRVQFGRAIGSFQAVKHRCADMLLEVELAKSAAYHAAAAADAADPNLPALASLAKSAAADAYMGAARTCIQLHGGIGFTWDHDAHLWFKRAKSSEVLFGDPGAHRERMLSCWLEQGATP
ncbi:MAG: acyl-CoA dehydrogenase family protein [Pseudomonadales bacterium]